MRPYYQSSRVTIYHADCRDVLPLLDMLASIVSDPPYGISYQHSGGVASNKGIVTDATTRNTTPIVGDDRPFDPAHLLGFERVGLFGANHYATRLPESGSWHVWDKTRGGFGPDDSFSDAEFVWVSAKKSARIFHHLWKGVCQDSEKGQRRLHPSRKPEAALAWLIRLLDVPPESLIVDPYAGTGTTAAAAIKLGYVSVSIEIEERYCEIAARRLESIEKGDLFLGEVPA